LILPAVVTHRNGEKKLGDWHLEILGSHGEAEQVNDRGAAEVKLIRAGRGESSLRELVVEQAIGQISRSTDLDTGGTTVEEPFGDWQKDVAPLTGVAFVAESAEPHHPKPSLVPLPGLVIGCDAPDGDSCAMQRSQFQRFAGSSPPRIQAMLRASAVDFSTVLDSK